MDTQYELDSEQQKLKSQIFPYLKALTYAILTSKPKNITSFMIDFLSKQGNYTSSGLTLSEKKELETLRNEIRHYRMLDSFNKKSIENEKNSEENSDSDESGDVMDSSEEEKIQKKFEISKSSNRQSQFSIKPRNSVSAEVYGIFNKKKIFVPKKIPKTNEQINRIKAKIISSFIFSSLDKNDIEIVINAMEEKKFKIDEKVITQGEPGDCLYIVETGSLSCFKILENGENKFLCNYGPGDAFGELALLYNCPRAASIVCSSDECILWDLDRETFNHIVKTSAQNKREKYEKFLKKVDILSTIDSYELGKICDSLKSGVYQKGDYIIKEGEMGDVFYIMEEGKCNATKTLEPGKPEEVINELKEGDYFGERALLSGEPRYANIIVISDTAKVISLDRNSFNRLLGPIMDILKRNMDKYNIYCSSNKEDNENNSNSSNNINDIPVSNNNNNDIIIEEIKIEEKKDDDAQNNENKNLEDIIKSDDLINNNNNTNNNNENKEEILEENNKEEIIIEEKKIDINDKSNNNNNNFQSLQDVIISQDNNEDDKKEENNK